MTQRHRSSPHWAWLVVWVGSGLAGLLWAAPQVLGAPPADEGRIRQAWELVQQAGRFHFTTELVQTTFPAPMLSNAGQTAREDRLTLDGSANLPENTFEMAVWPGDLASFSAEAAEQVRVVGNQSFRRDPASGAWVADPGTVTAFDPSANTLAFLLAAKQVQPLAVPSALPHLQGLAGYAFQVDGPAFAEHIRAQLEGYLRANGDLPPGLSLSVPALYAEMRGEGQVWLSAEGLPVRVAVSAEFPQQANGERVLARFATDYRDFAIPVSVVPGLYALGTLLPRTEADQMRAISAFLLTVVVLALAYALMRSLAAHTLYRLVVATLLLSLVLQAAGVPTLPALAYLEDQRAAQVTAEAEAAQTAAAQNAVQEALAPRPWAAHQDPLQPSAWQGLTVAGGKAPESVAVTNPAGDDDGDSLTNAQEAKLGTNPNDGDTDGDGLRDDLEVKGWLAGGTRWYSDPLNADMDASGVLDGVECANLRGKAANAIGNDKCTDTDNDGTPDLFDTDNDGDGVPDVTDLSPNAVIGPFSHAAPMPLQVNGVQAGQPVLVELHVRPVLTEHLTYAQNVLEWPAGDTRGNVQTTAYVTQTLTFAQAAGATANDPRLRAGNLRLTPCWKLTWAMMPTKASHFRAPCPPRRPASTRAGLAPP